jgi:hypothetical protein
MLSPGTTHFGFLVVENGLALAQLFIPHKIKIITQRSCLKTSQDKS